MHLKIYGFALALTVLPVTVLAQSATPSKATPEMREKMRTACAADVQKFCANVERGRDGIRECLQAHAAELSDGCKAAGAGQKGGKAREADARKPEGSSSQ